MTKLYSSNMPRLRKSVCDVSVRVSTSCCDDEWDHFVASSPHGFHEQTTLWSQVKAFYGWKPLRITLSDQKGIIAGAQILARTIRGAYRVGYASRGPVVPCNDPELIARTVEEICQAARREKVGYLAIAPPYGGHSVETALRARGFCRKPQPLPPGSVMTATLLIDLSQDLDRIHAQTRMQVRQHIRWAQRSGVVVREGGGNSDVQVFTSLMRSLCERRRVSPTPPEKDFFENLWTVFAPRGWVRIYLAEVDGQAVAALFVLAFGDTARVWKAGWNGEFGDRRPNNLVQWEAICWAKRQGFRYFDPMGIERQVAERLLTGAKIDWATIDGPTNFKIGYGGVPTLLPETQYLFLSAWPRLLLRMGGWRLLEEPRLAHLLERFSA